MVEREHRIAIIPARGGSKRIPGKNIYPFMGKPMIAWTIKAALESDLFSNVLVSTDSEEIAEISKQHGAVVPFLRDRFEDDYSPVSEAVIYSLQAMERHTGIRYDHITMLMPNCPLRDALTIQGVFDYHINAQDPAVISCFKFGFMNPWWAHILDSSNHPEPVFPFKEKGRSQDYEKLYCPSGAVWMALRENLLEANTFYAPGYSFFPINWKNAVDIDDHDDLELALAVYSLMNCGQNDEK